MGKKPEVRMSEGVAAFLVIAVIGVLVGAFTNWYGLGAAKEVPTTPTVTQTQTTPLQLIPAIEKTKVYVSTYDQADFDGEKQKNRVAGTGELIKSGVSIDTVTTVTTGAAASTAEFNGGDKVILMGTASGYYAHATAKTEISETLQPLEVFIKAAHAPSVSIQDSNGDTATAITLAANEVSKTHTLVIERPGDDTFYQFCGIAANYNDDQIEPRVKVAGSYETGEKVLADDYDALDTLGYDVVWAFDNPIKNFDELNVDFLVGTGKDINPSGDVLSFVIFDCEENVQNGEIAYTSEDSADVDMGLANIVANITIN